MFRTLQNLASQIVARRNLLGLTQQALCDLSGVSLRTIKVIEKGDKPYAIANLIQIADVLGLEAILSIKKING